MSASRRTPKGRRRERGAVLAMTGIAMIMIVAMAVIGVDVGRLAFTANEVQSLADVGATSGARALAMRAATQNNSIDPDAEARSVMHENWIGGEAASNDNVASIQFGTWTAAGGFTAGGIDTADAIEVTTTETVDNCFAGLLGTSQSTVQRRAVGHIDTPSCAPVLPVAIGDCNFDFDDPSDCENLPILRIKKLTGDEEGKNACWSSVNGVTPASANTFIGMLPATCCGNPGCGRGEQPPVAHVDDEIKVQNGADTAALQVLDGCTDLNPAIDFVVPIIPCSGSTLSCTGEGTVVGFAVANVVDVNWQGNDKSIDLQFKCDVTPTCAGGTPGESFGALVSSMVE